MQGSVVVMMMMMAVSGAHVLSADEAEGEIWAVLVAGSFGWLNYRHQADVCHAYQILHSHGVPDDHIIVMMVDDIAYNRANPTPGKIINRPDGPDVYEGVPKDYTGNDVTPENFMKILKGDADGLRDVGSGKVLKSGPKDRVFVNLVDHGAPDIFGFPKSFLHARNLSDTILAMHRNRQYKEMLVYLESCESGSMYKYLPDDIGVYALSASNASQPSFACYNDLHLHTFLGDVFSVKWMEDTDRNNPKETLKQQFLKVRREVNTSHVLQWGEKSLASQKVSKFLGSSSDEGDDYGPFLPIRDPCLNSSVSSEDVPLATLQSHLDNATEQDDIDYWNQQISELQQNRTLVEDTMRKLVERVTGDVENPYALRVVYVMVNLCEHGYTAKEFDGATSVLCNYPPIHGIN